MIRTLHSLGLILGMLLLVAACGADAPDDGGGTGNDGGATIDAMDVCQGCINSNGDCLPGESIIDCGGGGNACVTCDEGDQCAENECRTPPSCNEDNCAGCCLPDSTCVEIASQDGAQCGTTGFECTACASGICDQGVCKEACDATTCAGCCDGPTVDDCLEIGNDQSRMACGSGGMACTNCGGGVTCTQGACVDQSCNADCPNGCCDGATCRDGDSNNECGTGGEACFSCGVDQSCDTGVCVVDPDSLWNFVLVSADVPTTDGDGDAWDPFGGAPDVYIGVTLGVDSGAPVSGTTTADPIPDLNENQHSASFSPPNGEVVLSNVPASKILDSIRLEVQDEDVGPDDLMISIIDSMPPETVFGGGLFQLTTSGFTVRFKVVKP